MTSFLPERTQPRTRAPIFRTPSVLVRQMRRSSSREVTTTCADRLYTYYETNFIYSSCSGVATSCEPSLHAGTITDEHHCVNHLSAVWHPSVHLHFCKSEPKETENDSWKFFRLLSSSGGLPVLASVTFFFFFIASVRSRRRCASNDLPQRIQIAFWTMKFALAPTEAKASKSAT